VSVRSDVERKRLFGLAPNATSQGDIYTAEATARTYARLADCAQAIVSAGLPVVVDAASLHRHERRAFRVLALKLGVASALIACEAPLDVLRARVAARAAAGGDASEADLTVLERQLAWREELDQDEQSDVHVIDTASSLVQVEENCRQLASVLQRTGSR
jgi:predicted kinase